ncbi:hypothetical protein EDB84DRAFT_1557992 [Lactarius hengduanensis]|nr:hypothetical protein EDB84DRAFT_1557992 [Lactarius hengduanensis]
MLRSHQLRTDKTDLDRGHSRRPAYRDNGDACPRCSAHGKTQGDEAPFRRSARLHFRDLGVPALPACISPALRKTAKVGTPYNNARATHKEDDAFVGQATALMRAILQLILVDDNFSTILPAVEEVNIQNFLSFQLSTAAAALTLITLSTMFGLSNPLNAMQILFINILMDGPPSQSLGVDPIDHDVMRKPPRKKDEPIISRRILSRVAFSASVIVVGTLFVYYFALSDDQRMSRRDQTMVRVAYSFSCFVFLDLISAIENRGLGCGLTQNRMLVVTVAISFLSQLGLIYIPFMQAIFQTSALPLDDLLLLFALAATSFVMHEGRRRYERTLNQSETYAAATEELA